MAYAQYNSILLGVTKSLHGFKRNLAVSQYQALSYKEVKILSKCESYMII